MRGLKERIQYTLRTHPADSVKTIVDVFTGQPCLNNSYMLDRGYRLICDDVELYLIGWSNQFFIPILIDKLTMKCIRRVI